jgi:peptidylprolyl isomerase
VKPVSRRLRRLSTALLPLLLVTALSSCGDDEASPSGASSTKAGGSAESLDAVSIEGDPGTKPKVTWKSEMTAEDLETETLVEGDGAEVEQGDQVSTHIWIGNGFTQEKAYSSYDQGSPEIVTVDESLSPIFADAMDGATLGSRVAVTAPADQAFGETGNPQLGIGNKDSVLVIIDLISIHEVLDGPDGESKKAPSWAPGLVEKGDAITSLDFAGTPEPNGELRSATLIRGEGAVVKKGQTIDVNYLGQVYDGKKPFDESYSREPASFAIGAGAVIPGWDKVLVGVKVGSRVIMAIPPEEGYGEEGNSDAGIKGTDTLYFVVDVLGAS